MKTTQEQLDYLRQLIAETVRRESVGLSCQVVHLDGATRQVIQNLLEDFDELNRRSNSPTPVGTIGR